MKPSHIFLVFVTLLLVQHIECDLIATLVDEFKDWTDYLGLTEKTDSKRNIIGDSNFVEEKVKDELDPADEVKKHEAYFDRLPDSKKRKVINFKKEVEDDDDEYWDEIVVYDDMVKLDRVKKNKSKQKKVKKDNSKNIDANIENYLEETQIEKPLYLAEEISTSNNIKAQEKKHFIEAALADDDDAMIVSNFNDDAQLSCSVGSKEENDNCKNNILENECTGNCENNSQNKVKEVVENSEEVNKNYESSKNDELSKLKEMNYNNEISEANMQENHNREVDDTDDKNEFDILKSDEQIKDNLKDSRETYSESKIPENKKQERQYVEIKEMVEDYKQSEDILESNSEKENKDDQTIL